MKKRQPPSPPDIEARLAAIEERLARLEASRTAPGDGRTTARQEKARTVERCPGCGLPLKKRAGRCAACGRAALP